MKKVLLVITICEQNKERISNQIANLNKHSEYLSKFNIEPVFVYGNKDISVSTDPYTSWKLDVEESCVGLYKKIFASFEKALEQEFDYFLKIDDDTLFNINLFDRIELDADYIGRCHRGFSENKIVINLPMYNINKTIMLYPSFFTGSVHFATGDFYILSRKVVQYLVDVKSELFKLCNKEEEYILEDQLIGYALRDQWNKFTNKDIAYVTPETDKFVLQVTKDCVSVHPVNSNIFKSMIDLSPEDQIKKIADLKGTNFWNRKAQMERLESSLRAALHEFVNSKKIMGMG